MTANLGPAAFALSGTALLSSYVASSAYQIGRASRVTFYGNIILNTGSTITDVKVKLQCRYTDGTTTLTYLDLASDKGDKGCELGTVEVEHDYSALSAPVAGTPFRFFLDNPTGLVDVTINVKCDHVGIAGDSVTIYPVLG